MKWAGVFRGCPHGGIIVFPFNRHGTSLWTRSRHHGGVRRAASIQGTGGPAGRAAGCHYPERGTQEWE